MSAENLEVWSARSFDGGRNTWVSPYDIGEDESPDDLNVDSDTPGEVRKRDGCQLFVNQVLGSDAFTGLYSYYKQNGMEYLLALNGRILWWGIGLPPGAMAALKSDYTRGYYMTFATMQDWLYAHNFADIAYRWDGSSLSRHGVAMPFSTFFSGTAVPSNTTTGRMTSSSNYAYRFSFVYGRLGESNLSLNGVETLLGAADDTVTLTNLEWFRPGSGTTVTPAEAGQPTKIRIWRTHAYVAPGGGYFLNPDTEKIAMDMAYYLVAEISYPASGAVSYVDVAADDELFTQYGGHSLSEPYLDLIMPNSIYAWHAVRQGYQLTPRGRYLAKHRNRLFLANVREVGYTVTDGGSKADGAGVQQPAEDHTSRVYFSRLYQPDALDDFIDVFPEDGDFITGIRSYHDNLVIFKERHTYLLLGSSPDNFDVRTVNEFRGLVAPRTLEACEDLLYGQMGHDNIAAFTGDRFVKVALKIRPDLLSEDISDIPFNCAGAKLGRYYFAFREGPVE